MKTSSAPGNYVVPRPARLRSGITALALLLSFACFLRAANVPTRKAAARAQFESAEELRDNLERKPQRQRTRREYDRVIEAYRNVYRTAPTSMRADPSAFAAAELLAEEGRAFKDPALLQQAIEQYSFLCREYPGSTRRFESLLMVGNIYSEDLNDKAHARAAYEEFLRRYPRHPLAVEAASKLEALPTPFQTKTTPAENDQERAARSNIAKTPAPSPFAKHDGSKPARATLNNVRWVSNTDFTRIAIELDSSTRYQAGLVPDPDRLFFDIDNTRLDHNLLGKTFEVNDGLVRRIRVAPYRADLARVVLELEKDVDYSASLAANPWRIVIDLRRHKPPPILSASSSTPAGAGKATANKTAAETKPETASAATPAPTRQQPSANQVSPAANNPAAPAPVTTAQVNQPARGKRQPGAPREAQPTSAGQRSLTRALGLKIGRIVIDAGHGGHDTGTVGPAGLKEKDLVLDVALRLGKMLQSRLGADVVYTRDDDTFVPLEERTAIANQEQADLFISIHANSSPDPSARGIETYYLNFTSSKDALEVAARENASSTKTVYELQDLVKNIALKEKIDESREFAGNVQQSLWTGLVAKNSALHNRGVKKAPFVVLIGAHMPSILVEISFVSNPADERKLTTADYRQKIADSLYRGISRYAGGLSGVKMASAGPKSGAP
jgi:N-acetylmuramoyl-L-alanine amidase